MALRTFSASTLPFIALDAGIVITMSCIQPAVVYCPDDRYTGIFQIIKEQFIIEKITVDIMDMDNVRVQCFHLTNEPPGGQIGRQSVPVSQSRPEPMQCHTQLGSDRHKFGLAGSDSIPTTAICDIAVPAVSHRQFTNLLHNTPRRRISSDHRINLQ